MKGEQKRTKVFSSAYTGGPNPLVFTVNLMGVRWGDYTKTSPEFKDFLINKVKNINGCWKRAQERYIRHITYATDMESILVKLFFKYFSPPRVIRVDRSLYYAWLCELHLDYGKWTIAKRKGIDTDLMNITDV